MIPHDHIRFLTDLSALLAAAPVNLRSVNLHDRFTFANGVSREIEDCVELYGDCDGVDDDLGGDLIGEFAP